MLDTTADRCPSVEQPELAVSVREEAALLGGGTTGLTSWPAGRALAQWLDKPAIHQLLEEGLISSFSCDCNNHDMEG